jgi:hypothetical protein
MTAACAERTGIPKVLWQKMPESVDSLLIHGGSMATFGWCAAAVRQFPLFGIILSNDKRTLH